MTSLKQMWAAVHKYMVALVTFEIGWVTAIYSQPHPHVTAVLWILQATGVATALGVYAKTNPPA